MDDDIGACPQPKKVHPFFSAPQRHASKERAQSPVQQPITPDPSCSPNSDRVSSKLDQPASAVNGDGTDLGEVRRKRRKVDSFADTTKPSKQGHRGRQHSTSVGSDILNHFGQKEGGPVSGTENTCVKQEEVKESVQENKLLTPFAQALQSTLSSDNTTVADSDTKQEPKPQKFLKFNPKTGTIGSPPKPKAHAAGVDETPTIIPKPSTKPRRKKRATSRIVCILYGADDDGARAQIAEKIEEILSGVRYVPPENKLNGPSTISSSNLLSMANNPPSLSPGTPKKQIDQKVTHPFFVGKGKSAISAPASGAKDVSNSPGKKQTVFTSTPCSPKHIRPPQQKFNIPQFGLKAGGLKIPGAQLPAWPWQGMVHIRGDESDATSLKENAMTSTSESRKKEKGRRTSILANESIMNHTTYDLRLDELVEELKSLNTDAFQPPPAHLRIPKRHFESGKQLQARVSSQLRTIHSGQQAKAHPAISRAYGSLTTSLSAFDESTCESISWAQKYCPITADQVLQGGKEAGLLRDWLRALQVQSVDTGATDSSISKQKAAPSKKRKRKKLDNFIISSDEEEDEMDELPEADDDWTFTDGYVNARKTLIRNTSGKGSKDARFPNAVVLSGPHGCGKTAAVYAIAKELGFEVFEISPGARRSGKDILEKIGDMTRNHLVQHKQETSQPDEIVIDDEVARDLKSGKQGTMTAFFKPEASAKPKTVKEKPVKPLQASGVDKPIKKAAAKAQKQSLILLEEVDILYEEDKQFWTTVITLMAQSKRPFIMTCNDESLVPFQSLNLYGIFRFKIAPTDLAVDLLLLIAANEGHALRREAIQALYESRFHDLRASITELNYWCQIGVGDAKGGFSWFCRRWPSGSDINNHGDRIRVVSAGTYETGMGWLGRDAIIAPASYRTIDEEILKQACESWQLDLAQHELLTEQFSQAQNASTSTGCDRLEILDSTSAFYDSMSAADLVSCGTYSSLNQVKLDCALPGLSNKAKADFIIGRKVLDAHTLTRYDTLSLEMTASMKTLAGVQLPSTKQTRLAEIGPLDERKATQQIQGSFRNPPCNLPKISRSDYSVAFDPIAASEKPGFQATGFLDPSVFDRTMVIITLDVAPYVRGIVAYDQRLQAERLLRGNLLSEGGKPKKRLRTTRSAFSALEGGPRASTRRDKYFSADINTHLVMYTGGDGWASLAAPEAARSEDTSPTGSAQLSDDGEMDFSVG